MKIFERHSFFLFRAIKQCRKNHVVLALADQTKNGVKNWKDFKNFQLDDVDVVKIFQEQPKILDAMKELNFINDGEITPILINESWKTAKNLIWKKMKDSNISEDDVEKKIMEPIFVKIAGNSNISPKMVKDLLQEKYASKLSIMNCNRNFRTHENNRMSMDIMYIPSQFDKE